MPKNSMLTAIALVLLPLCTAYPVTANEPVQESSIHAGSTSYTLHTEDELQLSINRSNGFMSSLGIGKSRLPITPSPMIRFEEVVALRGSRNLLKSKPTINKASTVKLNQTQPQPLILSGQCSYRTQTDVAGFMNRGLALNIVGTYTDGEVMSEQSAYFGQYDHKAQFNSKILCPDKPLAQVVVTPTSSDAISVASFKDISLKQVEYRVSSPQDACSQLESTVSQQFRIPSAAISGIARYQATREAIIVRCRFSSTSGQDRAVSAYFTVPFDAIGGVWHDDVRTSRKIEAGRIYHRTDRWYGAGRDGYDDRYLFACVENKQGLTLCIATDPSEPRVFRTEYDAVKRELRIRYDIGFSPDAGRWANQGSFTACLFTCQNGDGFRGAADKYQRIFPWAFAKRVPQEGMWIPFVTPESIPGGWEDFNIRFVESLTNISWEQAHGMVSLKYVEPWLHHQTDMPDVVVNTVSGPADPSSSIRLAQEVSPERYPALPADVTSRFAAYTGSYITDNWGQPQGYFFRQAGRKENMMIVNPNPDLPAPPGSDFSSGGFDWDNIMEVNNLAVQWHIDGWITRRVAETPLVQIDTMTKTEGGQSLRLDPVPSKSYYPLWTRGVDQVFYTQGTTAGPFELSYSVKGQGMPKDGTSIGWTVTFWYADRAPERVSVKLDELDSNWKSHTHTLTAQAKPVAISIYIGKDIRNVDPTTLWVDDVKLTAVGESANLITNGGFETAQLTPGQFGGVYLDTMECYTNNLNYRREHWRYAEEPPTFDSARKPALYQPFSHITFGRRTAEWARARGKVVFANCSPATCFAAPYNDAMGGEESWLSGDQFVPKADSEFNFVRFMSGAKSWSILQYSDLSVEQINRYAMRCAFYGVYPSWIYKWSDPVFVAKIRPLYAKLMPVLVEINTAGWRPMTLASSSNPGIWLERFGDGRTTYLTIFNPTSSIQTTTVSIDKRAGTPSNATDMLDGCIVNLSGTDSVHFDLTIGSEQLKVIKIINKE